VDHHVHDVIGTRVEITYLDGSPAEVVEVTHYAVGRIARWARTNNLPGLSPDTAESLADQVLCLQLSCWAEKTRGQAHPVEFDEWCARVADFNPVESTEMDPTQPAT
jgi:hypothetical protein